MPEREIDFNHHPEVVENGKGTRRLELLGAKETFADTEARREFFATLEDDRFTKILGYVNSVTRGKAIEYDYSDAWTFSLATPPPEDKEPLMQETFHVVREILGQDLLDDETAMRRASLTIAGAINYIHPYSDGNGRTGRVMHYLMEFGSERGDQAFNDELYATIAKIPAYDIHSGIPIYDGPPPELTRALDATARDRDPERWSNLDERARASERVVAFLKMMQARMVVPVEQDFHRAYRDPLSYGPRNFTTTPAGTVDGLTIYEQEYLGRSAVPHYRPEEVPPEALKVTARRQKRDGSKKGPPLNMDIVTNV